MVCQRGASIELSADLLNKAMFKLSFLTHIVKQSGLKVLYQDNSCSFVLHSFLDVKMYFTAVVFIQTFTQVVFPTFTESLMFLCHPKECFLKTQLP